MGIVLRRGNRRSNEPELFGAKEAAEALGVGQTNLRTVAGLPEPYQPVTVGRDKSDRPILDEAVAATTLWRAAEIRALADERDRLDAEAAA